MQRAMNVNEEIELSNGDTSTKFRIIDILGVGGSCIAYSVSYIEHGEIPHTGILKEFCPYYLEDFNFYRDNNSICVPKECFDEFDRGIRDFENTYKVINEYLSLNLSATNYHTVQIGLYEGNNTVYSLTSCDYGKSYDKITDGNLLSVLKIMLSVTKAVEMYHNAGYLHLDIKPKNILVLDDITELVKLFDFDSLTSIQQLKSKNVDTLPVPEDYYVPELENFDLRNICFQTDIYEIGAMIYSRLFKRKPTVDDVYAIDLVDIEESDLVIGLSPQTKYELIDLLKNTLQISRRKRYKSTSELKTQLEKIISFLSNKSPYLLDMPKWQPSVNFVGRQKELTEIKERLHEDGYVFIRGIGGLGKSEIAKIFAKSFADEYHTVQFCKFNNSLRTVIAAMPFDGISDDDYTDFNELVNTKNKVLHLCDEHTLIIVDNFNVTYDEFLRDFLPSNSKSFKVIFTTRCNPAADYYKNKVYELPKLSEEECKTVFRLHSHIGVSNENDEKIEKIINKTDYNTLIIILIARVLNKTGIAMSEILEKLERQELKSLKQKIFHEYDILDEEAEVYNAMYAHLNVIFSVSALSYIQKEILKNATLIPIEGLGVADFVYGCDKSTINKNSVYELAEWGWLNIDSDDTINMHPIISDLVSANDFIKKEDSYYNLAETLEAYCNPDYMSHISVVMNRLSCAIQLERRYKNEDVFKRCMIAAKLGRMYENAYYPSEAKKYLLKALEIAKNEKGKRGLPNSYKAHKSLKEKLIIREMNISGKANKMLLPYIYYFLGEFEKDFGTKTNAIDYFKKSLAEAKKIGFVEIILDSKIGIAECYSDNNNLEQAYKEYVSSFKYARAFRLKHYLTSIANDLSDVCARLDLSEEENKYKKYADKYRIYSMEEESPDGLNEYADAINSGDFEESLKQYELFLAKQREILGESSPVYKSLAQGQWVFYAINNQKNQALRYLNESITFISSTHGENSMELAECLALAASLMPDLTEFDYAYQFANRAISICNNNGETDSYIYCQAKLALANIALVIGKAQEAEAYINDIDFSLFSGNDFIEDTIQTAGIVLANLSKYDKLEPMCINLLSKKNAGCISKFQANILMSIMKEQQGYLDEAEKYADESTQYIDSIKTSYLKNEWMVQYYRACARLDFRKGQYESAIRKLNEMFALFAENEKDKFLLYSAYLERGLYYSLCRDNSAAMQDFEQCEKILNNNHCSEETFFVLYNNIAVNYQRVCEYEKAMNFLNKAAKINPNVFSPTTYYETMVCGNIGWVSYLLGDLKKGERCINTAIKSFEKLGVDKSNDYFVSKCNLAFVFEAQKRYKEALDILLDIRRKYSPASDASGEFANNTCEGILKAYFELDQANEAYDFACKELNDLELWFGKYSMIRINEIIKMGGLFRVNGYTDCYDFFVLAEKLLYDSAQNNTVLYALILNYIGVCKTDYEEKHVEACRYFEKAKLLFEELNETENDNYKTVLENIENVSELKNELIKNLADSIVGGNMDE